MQAVDLLVSGDESAPDCKVLVTCRPGRQLTADTLQSIAYLCTSSLSGLSPQRLSILDTEGHLLYSDGQVRAALTLPPSRTHPLWWLLLAVGLALGGAFLALHGRRAAGPRADDLWEGLIRRQEAELLSLLASERPETIGLLLENLPQPAAERLRRGLRRRQIVLVASPLPVDPQVVEAVKLSLQRRLSGF